ncbi:MAG: DUF1572 family protein [Phycisphaerae bacterium]|nr:DUF1572 domain-containing protein [Phycisphaerae bacterium]NUQ44509.1 DUF1572 family protein [Phycisphaerae bacterium]
MSFGALSTFRDYAAAKLDDHLRQALRCARLLSGEQMWFRVNERSNSVGNLLLHLRGNVAQWIVAGIGGRSFERDRPAEFARRHPLPTEQLVADLESTVSDARRIISGLSDARLAEPVSIQGYDTTVVAAVFHVVEHFAFHTGQIVWATKVLLNVDLSLYDAHGRRLDARNAAP